MFLISQQKHLLHVWVFLEKIHLSTQNIFLNGWIRKHLQFKAFKKVSLSICAFAVKACFYKMKRHVYNVF